MAGTQPPPHVPALLHDDRVAALLAWVSRQVDQDRQAEAIAAALAVLDRADRAGVTDGGLVAGCIWSAVTDCRPLRVRPAPRTVPLRRDDLVPAPVPRTADDSRPGLLGLDLVALDVLRRAGIELDRLPEVARRLAVALDVAVAHWLQDARPGGGLPPYGPEHGRYYQDRLIFKLGSDRDLFRLVAGPQPGRGRPVEVAWQRGLAYWAASCWAARISGQPVLPVPAEIAASWRKQILAVAPEAVITAIPADSRYARPA